MSLLSQEAESCSKHVDWLHISSVMFGTCMIHNVVHRQLTLEHDNMGFGGNAWFQAFIYNFGEVMDRVKLFALLQDNEYVIRSPSYVSLSFEKRNNLAYLSVTLTSYRIASFP